MASLPSISFLILLLSTTHLSLSTATTTSDIHDLLPKYGLPKGLLPDAVTSYSLSPDGAFTVHLSRPCYVHFDQLVYYDKTIRGRLTYGSVSDVSGIQAKKLFLWVTVDGMDLDSGSGMIEFHVGALSQKLPAKQFETVPRCQTKGCQASLVESI
ncbi:hypothetical protein RJ639_038854 [Escallonia herrerae]|uniref:Uncharacterized protein n=1 Tax=Escallonia herrerae TaxID=1293975 RepID=A0AA89B6R9_9ASTE|nr:hypothetical protein RJ639_038854 [Escallonia herrerae]